MPKSTIDMILEVKLTDRWMALLEAARVRHRAAVKLGLVPPPTRR